jgi:di/tricarboxylate transporter
MDPYESPRVDPYASGELADGDLLPPEPAGERVTMLHGLLYVGGVGAAACLNEHVREAWQAGDFPWNWWPLAILVALDAAGLAALVLVIWRRVERRRSFPVQFGHWLLLALGVECLVVGIFPLIEYPFIAGRELNEMGGLPPELEKRWRTIASLVCVLLVITPALAMVYCRSTKLWQCYAPLMIANALWLGVQYYLAWDQDPSAKTVTNVITFLRLLVFLIAAGSDVRHAAGKDQIHWVGLGMHCGLIFYHRFVEYYWGTQ